MYNAYQNYQIDNIDNQIKNLERQRALLTQSQQQPIVNNYLNTQPIIPTQYDFNGKWVENEEEAKSVSNANLPLLIMNKNESKFYMKNVDGTFKTYKFEESIEVKEDDNVLEQIKAMQLDIDKLTEAIGTILANKDTIIPTAKNNAQNGSKSSNKEMKINESIV